MEAPAGNIVISVGLFGHGVDNEFWIKCAKGMLDDSHKRKIDVADGFFVHENKGSFFHKDGGQKRFTLAMGREWTGGVVFDDLC